MSCVRAGRLLYRWSGREKDWLINYPRSQDGHLMHSVTSGHMDWPTFKNELEERGYDITTLRIQVDRFPPEKKEGDDEP